MALGITLGQKGVSNYSSLEWPVCVVSNSLCHPPVERTFRERTAIYPPRLRRDLHLEWAAASTATQEPNLLSPCLPRWSSLGHHGDGSPSNLPGVRQPHRGLARQRQQTQQTSTQRSEVPLKGHKGRFFGVFFWFFLFLVRWQLSLVGLFS